MGYFRISWQGGSVTAATLCFLGCAVGPNYHKPTVQIPESFKEGVDWQRAQANPQGSLSSTWWLDYHDDKLSKLIDQALHANQTIIAADAAYRLAQATVSASTAALFPTVSANTSATRAQYGSRAAASVAAPPGAYHYVTAGVSASWELDLWGKTRRQIESSKAQAQASDAERAGQRLSIAATLASDYFAMRQADVDIDFLRQQQKIYGDLSGMTKAG
jgi:outer membrane protein TolC